MVDLTTASLYSSRADLNSSASSMKGLGDLASGIGGLTSLLAPRAGVRDREERGW